MWLCYLTRSRYSKRNLSLVFTFLLVPLTATCWFPKSRLFLSYDHNTQVISLRNNFSWPLRYNNAPRNRKRNKERKDPIWFGVYRMRVYQPGNRIYNSRLKRNFYNTRILFNQRWKEENKYNFRHNLWEVFVCQLYLSPFLVTWMFHGDLNYSSKF